MCALKLIGLIWEINEPCPNYSNTPKGRVRVGGSSPAMTGGVLVVEVGRRGDGGARWGGEVTVVQPRPVGSRWGKRGRSRGRWGGSRGRHIVDKDEWRLTRGGRHEEGEAWSTGHELGGGGSHEPLLCNRPRCRVTQRLYSVAVYTISFRVTKMHEEFLPVNCLII
jgi:hypothetical protein